MSTNATLQQNHSSLPLPLLRVGEEARDVGGQAQGRGGSMRCADMASGSSSAHRTATWMERVGVEYMPVVGVGKASGVVDCDLWN